MKSTLVLHFKKSFMAKPAIVLPTGICCDNAKRKYVSIYILIKEEPISYPLLLRVRFKIHVIMRRDESVQCFVLRSKRISKLLTYINPQSRLAY